MEIEKWYKKESKQIYTLAGYAGTGKSYLTKYAINKLNLKKNEIALCTFTGKASLILMKYNDSYGNITTIHRLIYDLGSDPSGDSYFKLKAELTNIRLIVVDEVSMVNEKLLIDLKSFGILILALGDHGQLEAIGKQTDLLKDPDFVLDEIMRQAEGSAIIHLSMLVRQQKKIELGSYGKEAYVISKSSSQACAKTMARADQVLCGFNKTRIRLNEEIRHFKGMTSKLPQFGDKVINLENNWSKNVEGFNLVNGMVGYVVNEPIKMKHPQAGIDVMKIDMQPDFLNGVFRELYIPLGDFVGSNVELSKLQRKLLDRMTYGDVITTHKSQGSQWDNVFVWNEPFGEEPWRHPYTSITRASKNLILAI